MVYTALKNNKIVFVCESDSEDGVKKSLFGISYDKIKSIPNDYFSGTIGQDIREFDSNGELKPISQRTEYITIPDGMKIENEKIVTMTLLDKINSGAVELQNDQKYNPETESIVYKTNEELFSDGIITADEYYNLKLTECQIKRRREYSLYSDGLFFDWQRGDIEKQVWIDSVKAIKNKYPKPVKS